MFEFLSSKGDLPGFAIKFFRGLWNKAQAGDTQSLVTLIFISIIVVLFLLAVSLYLPPLWSLKRRMVRARKIVQKAINGSDDLNQARIKTAEGVFRNRDDARRWKRFRDAWDASCAKNQESGSVEIQGYFGAAEIITSTARIRLLQAMPGALLSLGILGTFVGLTMGLTGISSIDITDSKLLLENVQGLIRGLNIAFLTSVFGIFFSIVFLFWERFTYSGAMRSILNFHAEVEAAFPVTSPGELISRIWQNGDQQLQVLKTLGQDIASSISDSIGGSIQKTLGPALEDLKEAIVEMKESAGQAQVESMNKLVTHFVDQMNTSLGNQFDQLGDTVGGLTKDLSTLSERLTASAEAQEELLEKTRSVTEVVAVQLPAMLEFGSGMKGVSQALSGAIEKVEVLRTALSEQVDISARAQEKAAAAINEASSGIAESANRMEGASKELGSLAQAIEGALSKGMEQFEENIRGGVTDILQAFDSQLSDILGRFSGTLSDARESIEGLAEHSRTVANVIGERHWASI